MMLFEEGDTAQAEVVAGGGRVMIVEDQPPLRRNLVQLLQLEGFAVEEAADGASALARLDLLAEDGNTCPQLVLLDVGLPDVEGYDICREIKRDARLAHVPVIFLSGRVELQDRLTGYEAGAEDYIAKPYINAELLSKVQVALRNGEARKANLSLERQVGDAIRTAFTAMTSASEIGSVLQFLKNSFALPDNEALLQAVLTTLCDFGFDASVQLRSCRGELSLSKDGPCGQLEISLMQTLASKGHIVDAGRVSVFSYGSVSVAVKDMPREDVELCGRIRDNVAFLCEGAAARLAALDADYRRQQQQQVLSDLVRHTRQTLAVIDKRFKQQQSDSAAIMLRLRERVEGAFVSLGLTEGQEAMMARLIADAADESLALYDQGVEVDQGVQQLLRALDAQSAT